MTSAYFRWSRKMEARLAEAKAKGSKRGPDKLAPQHGVWWVRYRNAAGVKVREPTKAARREEAEAIAHQLAELASRRARGLETDVLRLITCETLFSEYLEAHQHLAGIDVVTSKTNKWLAPGLGRRPVIDVTPADCQRVINGALKAGLKHSTARELQKRGRAIFEWGRTHLKALKTNPWDALAPVAVPKSEVIHLAPHQVHTLLAKAGDWRLLLLVAVLCGPRKGELAALRWTDIAWMEGPHGTLRIRRSWEKEYPKDKEPRAIPLHPVLAAELRAAERAATSPLMFPSPKTGRVRAKAWNASRGLRRIAADAGVRLPEGTVWKSLRASFLTSLVRDSGGDVESAQKLAGHSKLETTQRYYLAKDMERLAARVGALSLAPPAATAHESRTQNETQRGASTKAPRNGGKY